MPPSKGRVPVEGLEHPRTAAHPTTAAASKVLFVKVAGRLCQLPV
jgi:hypothetical protein